MKLEDLKMEPSQVFLRTTKDSNIDSKIKKVVSLTPDEYIEQAYEVTDKRLGGSFNGWMASNQRTEDDIKRYAQAMKNGERFPLPWIDYDAGSQDGRNRALAAKSLGIDKIPVGIVPHKDREERIAEITKELENAKGYRKFRLESELQKIMNDKK